MTASPPLAPVAPPPATSPSAPDAAPTAPEASPRFDALMALLGLWFVVGMFVDAWAHHHTLPETFWTPWHGLLYSGFLALAVALLLGLQRGRRAGRTWREALPRGYLPGLAGAAVFALGGVGDAVWHTLFGIEANVDAIFSPSHLTLSIGAMLLLAGPLRSAWRRAGSLRDAGWGRAWPATLSIAYSLLLIHFFIQFAHPYLEVWPAVKPGEDRRPSQLYLTDGEGRNPRRFETGGLDAQNPSLGPDGMRLIFSASEEPPTSDPTSEVHAGLYSLDLRNSGAKAELLVDDEDADLILPALSPDGRRLAYVRRDHDGSALWLADADGGDAEVLDIDVGDLALSDPYWPAWSPDSERLAFSAELDGQSDLFSAELDGQSDLFSVALDGGDLERLTDDPAEDRHPAWSPDGKRLAFSSDRGGSFQIYTMDDRGRDLRQRTTAADLLDAARDAGVLRQDARVSRWPRPGEADAWAPRWLEGGSGLALTTNTAGDVDLALLDLQDEQDGGVRILPGAPDQNESLAVVSTFNGGLLYQANSDGPSLTFMSQAIGSLGQLTAALSLIGVLLFALMRWPWPGLPAGSLALVLGLDAVALSVLQDEWRMLAAGLVTAVVVELLYHLLRPSPARSGAWRWFAFLVPFSYLLIANLAVILTEGMGWTVHLWTGTAVMAGLAGVLLSFLVTGLAPDGRIEHDGRSSPDGRDGQGGWGGPDGQGGQGGSHVGAAGP
ncbi:MAG: TolB family protein [Anaerolineae bacterium]